MPLYPGTHLGPYEITGPLGSGGMGEVYRARDTRLERTVAIKILPQELSNDPIRKQRFEREAKTISSLNHPHICVLHDVGHQDGMDYLVMECVEGETLARRLEKGPLPLEQVLKFGAQIADALDRAHRSGIVHRDLKPGNIMLTPGGAKLLDFGLAKAATALASTATLTAVRTAPVTEEGTIVGTFQYMSPEQIEGKDLDGRSDIFSLGAVLYEMVTGKLAFEGKSQLSVASAILENEPEPISAAKPMTPPALDHAVKNCLAKLPDERWQTASDLALELKWIAAGGSQAGEAVGVPSGRGRWERASWLLTSALFRVSSSGGSPMEMTKPDSSRFETSHRWPLFLPDGKHFLYLAANFSGQTENNAIFLGSLDSRERSLVVNTSANAAYAEPGYLVYMRDKALVAQPFDRRRYVLSGEPHALSDEVLYASLVGRAVFSASNGEGLVTQTGKGASLSPLILFDRSGKAP